MDQEIRQLLILALGDERNILARQCANIYALHGRAEAIGFVRGCWYVHGGRFHAEITAIVKVFFGYDATIASARLTPA